MFDIGFSELVAVGLIALIILGPKRLPEVARTAGRWMGKLRRFITDVKQDLDREIQHEELIELRKLKQELSDTRHLMESASGDLIKDFSELASESDPATLSKEPAAKAVAGTAASAPLAKHARTRSGTKSPSGAKHGRKRQPRRR